MQFCHSQCACVCVQCNVVFMYYDLYYNQGTVLKLIRLHRSTQYDLIRKEMKSTPQQNEFSDTQRCMNFIRITIFPTFFWVILADYRSLVK